MKIMQSPIGNFGNNVGKVFLFYFYNNISFFLFGMSLGVVVVGE